MHDHFSSNTLQFIKRVYQSPLLIELGLETWN
jgi:hypothetical protein